LIRVSITSGLWTVTLDRPDKANALTADMLRRLADCLGTAAREGVRGLVLTGAGRVFSAGADLDEARAGLATSPLWEEVSGLLAALECPTVAALNGTLAGGAFGMALACDLRIAVPDARFFYPVMRLGHLPQPSDPGRLRALVGPARARMLLVAGQKIDAGTALAWGLVDEIVAPDTLVDRAGALLSDALAADPAHVSAIRAMLR